MTTALLIYIVSSAALGSLVLTLVLLLGTNQMDAEKFSAYEFGFEPFSDSRDTFDVKFYLVGLLFLIFDIEIAFLFPWAILVLTGSKALVWLILLFSLILIVGFVLEMKLKVLDWKMTASSLNVNLFTV
jgi:NADH-quinone oxidoreductase subunit A